jgi:hypothetical protein
LILRLFKNKIKYSGYSGGHGREVIIINVEGKKGILDTSE